MATLERPGVEVEQVVVNNTPTVLAAALPACVVGPCYQIVSPTTAEGVLDSTSVVITPAQITGDVIAEPIACNGKQLKVVVNGGNPQVIILPTPLSGNPLTFTTIVSSINKQLAGATSAVVNDKLVITTLNKGDSSSLFLAATDGTSAYADLGLSSVDLTEFKGKSKYDNTTSIVQFSSLPATKTATSNLSWDANNIDLYNYRGSGEPVKLSDVSAIIHNSWSNGTIDRIFNTDIDDGGFDGNYFQPIVSKRIGLYGKNVGGGKTNTVFHPGTHASLTLPLRNNVGNGGTSPDTTGGNYLYVEALGLQGFVSNKDAAIGNYVGKAGNEVSVKITSGVATGVAWNAGLKQLQITLLDSGAGASSVTYAQLETALNTITGGFDATKDLSISLKYTNGAAAVTENDISGANAITCYLTGGSDPLNFAAADSSATKNLVATVTGSVKVGSFTGADLGLTGEWIDLSINGSPAIRTTFASGTSVVTTLNTTLASSILGAAGTVTVDNVAVNAYARSVTITSQFGESVAVLQLLANPSPTSSFYKQYQDSTIQVVAYSNTKVVQKLFSGVRDNFKNGISITPDNNDAGTGSSLHHSSYNSIAGPTSLVGSVMERGLVPGSQALSLLSVKAQAAIVFAPNTTAAVWTGAAFNVVLTHSAVGGDTTITTAGGAANYAAAVGQIQTALAALGGAHAASIVVASRTINGVACLCFIDKTGTGTLKVKGTTTAAVKTALTNTATNGATLYDVPYSSVTTSFTLADSSVGGWTVTGISSSMSQVKFADNIGFINTNTAHLTEYFLDSSATVTYTKYMGATNGGDLKTTFVRSAGNVPLAAFFSGSSANLSWKQGWASSFAQDSKDYTGRIFTGGSALAKVGDSLNNAGTPYGRISAIQSLNIAGYAAFSGAQLLLSESSVDTYGILTDWYVRAEALDTYSPARNVAPEVVIDTATQNITVKAAVNRSSAGIPSAVTSTLYAGYTALRLDVTPAAANPSLMSFQDTTEVETLIGPISPANPLAFGIAKAFDNAPTVQITGMGVDDVSADAPYGTAEAYSRAFTELERYEVYAIAPMTFDREVHKLLALHCSTMSLPGGKKERAGICCTTLPTEKESLLCLSGTMTATEGAAGKWTLTIEGKSFVDALDGKKDANGNTISAFPGATFSAANGIYIDRSGDAYKYLVTEISSTTEIVIEVDYAFDAGGGPGSNGNDDGYYKEDASALAEFPAAGENCSLLVRQASIDDTTTTGKNQQVEAIAAFASGFAMSRFTEIQPAYFGTLVNGTETLVEGFYFCAAWAGASSQQNPAQGFTNFPMVGFTRPIGSNDKFTETQMATAAAGGVNWIIQDVSGGPVFSRHQLTTNTSSLKTREWSVVKAVDYAAKLLRESVKGYIGRYNITKALLEEISITCTSVCSSLGGTVLAEISVTGIKVSDTAPDHVELDIVAVPFYPANKIKIRITV